MNASDYRTYRDEQVIRKELNKPKTAKKSRTSNYSYTATQSPKAIITTKEQAIKDTLLSYKRLNNKYLELNEMINHYTPTANIAKYGGIATHTNKKYDISDEIVKREKIAIELINTSILRMHIKDCLYKITALSHSDILYLITAYVDETEKISYPKTRRIIKKIVTLDIKIPTIEQAKKYLNEKYNENP
jgi:hypothetical protein